MRTGPAVLSHVVCVYDNIREATETRARSIPEHFPWLSNTRAAVRGILPDTAFAPPTRVGSPEIGGTFDEHKP